MDSLARLPDMHLHASPEPGHQVFLDWDKVPGAARYSLFISHRADGVYEYFKDVAGNKATLLLKASKNRDRFYFIIVPKDAKGAFLGRSKEAFVEMMFD
jgi:hypothetical protein